MEKKKLVISIKAQQRSNASPVNKMFSAYICRKMSVLPALNTFFTPNSLDFGHDDSVDVDEVQQPYDTYQEGYYHQYPDIALVAILIVLVFFSVVFIVI